MKDAIKTLRRVFWAKVNSNTNNCLLLRPTTEVPSKVFVIMSVQHNNDAMDDSVDDRKLPMKMSEIEMHAGIG